MSDEASERWRALLETARDAYNEAAGIVMGLVSLSLKTVHNACYDRLRADFPLLSSQMAVKCEQAALSAVKSIRSNKHKGAKTPERKSLTMVLDKRLYGLMTTEGITLSGIVPNKRVLVPFDLFPKAAQMLADYKACDPTMFYRDGRFYLSVPFEVPERPVTNDTCIGVDMGERQFFVTSEGKAFDDHRYLAERRKVRYNKRALQSKGTKSAKRRLKKARRHEANMSKDMCYRAAKALIESTDAGVLVFEDLSKIKQKTAKNKEGYTRKRHNNAFGQVPLREFRRIVEYKAPLAGKRVETVSPTYTSQTDSRTGKKNGERRGRRFYASDGVVLDADWNAAINIGQRSKHPVSSSLPMDGSIVPLSGRRVSVRQSRGRA